jgi:dihydroxyacid dehydratase/phosphogluconate dehydratase
LIAPMGMGHLGTFHSQALIEEVSNGVFEAGGKPGVFTVSDICDGVVQATSGMSYSLISRDFMAAMVEIHALGHPHDGMVLLSGNDKSVPAHLLAIARCDLPAIHLPGGTHLNAPPNVPRRKWYECSLTDKPSRRSTQSTQPTPLERDQLSRLVAPPIRRHMSMTAPSGSTRQQMGL